MRESGSGYRWALTFGDIISPTAETRRVTAADMDDLMHSDGLAFPFGLLVESVGCLGHEQAQVRGPNWELISVLDLASWWPPSSKLKSSDESGFQYPSRRCSRQ
ncbi:hypothetical protein Baya_1779 [Bagarius yarrelli]|uniref:Uncharacterized protein n=1 Tax=Bagarius yarrelli TaxID=175774 RepID=A0A556TM35_BAGYA|nr:hypothetical protein Baya_1779 [Bagarius yarrelli]